MVLAILKVIIERHEQLMETCCTLQDHFAYVHVIGTHLKEENVWTATAKSLQQ